MEWLDEEWVAAVAGLATSLPGAEGADGVVSLSFAVAPRRERPVHWRYQNGKVVEAASGATAEPPDLALTLAADDAADVLSGRVEPSVAFMRGRLKASGAGALLLAFLASTTGSDYEAWRARVAALAPLP